MEMESNVIFLIRYFLKLNFACNQTNPSNWIKLPLNNKNLNSVGKII